MAFPVSLQFDNTLRTRMDYLTYLVMSGSGVRIGIDPIPIKSKKMMSYLQ